MIWGKMMGRFAKKSSQKWLMLVGLLGVCCSALAEDFTGLATFFIGLPSLILGTIVVGIITVGYYLFPSRSKKIIGITLGVPILLFNLLVIFMDTINLLQKELAHSTDTVSKLGTVLIFAIYPALCGLLGYFIYRLYRNKFKKWENN